jgi:hypothetical protein
MKPNIVESPASKLFRILVVGGLSMAATAGCSSSTPSGDGDASATGDAAKDSSSSHSEDVATHNDSAPIMDGTTDSCIPYDGRWDGPDGGICAHGVCAW